MGEEGREDGEEGRWVRRRGEGAGHLLIGLTYTCCCIGNSCSNKYRAFASITLTDRLYIGEKNPHPSS